MFLKAKQNAWDSKQKAYESKSRPSTATSDTKIGSERLNRILTLETDIIDEDGSLEPKPAATPKRSLNDYNLNYENKIDADEREFVNYELMFQDLPLRET